CEAGYALINELPIAAHQYDSADNPLLLQCTVDCRIDARRRLRGRLRRVRPLAHDRSELLRIRHPGEHPDFTVLVEIDQTRRTVEMQRAHQGFVGGNGFCRCGLQTCLWRHTSIVEVALVLFESRRRISRLQDGSVLSATLGIDHSDQQIPDLYVRCSYCPHCRPE